MPLVLLPMTPSDALSWQYIKEAGFPTHRILYNGPIDATVLSAAADAKRSEINAPGLWHWKIVDTDLAPGEHDPPENGGRSVAIAIWGVYNVPSGKKENQVGRGDKEGEAKETPAILRSPPPGLRIDAVEAMLAPIRAAQTEIMGSEKPYLKLGMFVTHPDHQGRGAGRKLLDWGLKKADEEGFSVYLDSTVVGRPMYERRGFEVVKDVEWDRRPWGGDDSERFSCMVRQPVSK